jgi:D-threo-aldose 1-dehydrogenase
VPDGAAGLALGPLGQGCADVGNLYAAMSDHQAHAVLEAAWDCGVRYFDTAPHYGLGLSERRLGAFLATRPRAEYVVSTKVGRLLRPSPDTAHLQDDAHQFAVPAALRRVWDASADGVRRSLAESLARLGLDRVDVLYLHDPEEHDLEASLATALPALAELREQGVVTAVGIGSKSVPALLAGLHTGVLDLVMVAGRYTLAEQPAQQLLPACRAAGVGVVAAAVYNSGLLSRPAPDIRARYEYGDVPADVLAHARAIEQVCAAHGVPLPAAALQYPLQNPVVRSVVVGAASPEQVRENSARLSTEVPDGLWDELRERGLVRP